MLALIARQALGLIVITSPLWGAKLLTLWIKKNRRDFYGSDTSGSATYLAASIRDGL